MIGLLVAESTARITERVKSRRKNSTANAAPMPAAIPPSQKASRLSMGLGREIKSAVIPIRTGSIAASSDTAMTALHIVYPGSNAAVPKGNTRRRGGNILVAHVSSPHIHSVADAA